MRLRTRLPLLTYLLKKRSCFMRMARKLRNKGFEVTCPAEF